MNFPVSLFLDAVVAVLLVFTIGYAVLLNRRLSALRGDKSELAKLAASFHDSTVKAEDSIGRLKISAEGLQEDLIRAQALREDLSYLIERSESEADRLEKTVRDARENKPNPRTLSGAAGGVARVVRDFPTIESGRREPRSEAERELLKALKAAH